MSKSKGNILTVSVLEEKGYDPLVYRFFCLQSHYRKPLEFTFEKDEDNTNGFDNAKVAYEKLKKRCLEVKKAVADSVGAEGVAAITKAVNGSVSDESGKKTGIFYGPISEDGFKTLEKYGVSRKTFEEYDAGFKDALGNDLNTSMATTLVYDVLKADISAADKLALIESFDKVLGLDLTIEKEAPAPSVDPEFEKYILEQIELRKAAKKEKNFAEADRIRAELLEKGVVLEDTREGVKWKLTK